MALTFPPISATTLSSSDCRQPVMKTCAPSWAKRFAAPRPRPALPPVTTAILFASFLLMTILRDYYEGMGAGTRRAVAYAVDETLLLSLRISFLACDRTPARGIRGAAPGQRHRLVMPSFRDK
jgi:hypothetical protein